MQTDIASQRPVARSSGSAVAERAVNKYRLTVMFALVASAILAATFFIINVVAGNLAEGNLLRMTEENTARDALHIAAMVSGQHRMPGDTMPEMRHSQPLTLHSLVAPHGQLSSNYEGLVEGLNIVKLNLFDLTGEIVWSSDPESTGVNKRESPLYQKAANGDISSKLVRNWEVTGPDGRRLDVVETYLPLLDTPSGSIIGVLEIYRDITEDAIIQVDDTMSSITLLTLTTLAALFLALSSFVVTADVKIHRSRRREMALVEGQLTERKQTEEQALASLKEKEALLKEIHHRVKNNLQIISSLLSLQAGHIKNQEAQEMFTDSQNRVRSMAMIHESLYRSNDLAKIDFSEYIRNLTSGLLHTYGFSARAVTLEVDVGDVRLNVDTAVPCGLIINELVSNSMKYAFPDGREGEIRVSLHPGADYIFTLTITDNGVGFPEGLDFRNTESLGLQLVNSLTAQLDGTVELDTTTGTAFKITFAEPN